MYATPNDKNSTSITAPGSTRPLPPLSILSNEPMTCANHERTKTDSIGRLIVQTLEESGVSTELKHIECGPVVTRYELIPAAGVRIESVSALSQHLAFTLKAQSVRAQAPMPGSGTIGIEVPHTTTRTVLLREILEGPQWQTDQLEIPIILGKDVGGRAIVADLAFMPHLLIAGATGSGKTVCINSILAGLLMSRTPEQLQLMLIDPMNIEFSAYNHLPHLLGMRNEIITDPKKVAGGLRWAVCEMEKRYQIMTKAGVVNIKSYNSRKREKHQSPSDVNDNYSHLPNQLSYILIIIEELADLMLTEQTEIESYITRLALVSREAGIHLILATRQPMVNVLTGTIKANFPARIAFQVTRKVDSRTILDGNGAENLLGLGDMLYMPPGSNNLIRIQGALTTNEDIRSIVGFIKNEGRETDNFVEQERSDSKEKGLAWKM